MAKFHITYTIQQEGELLKCESWIISPCLHTYIIDVYVISIFNGYLGYLLIPRFKAHMLTFLNSYRDSYTTIVGARSSQNHYNKGR